MFFSSLYVSSLLTKRPVMNAVLGWFRIRAHLNGFVLSWLQLHRSYLQIRSYSQILKVIGLQCIFWGRNNSTHNNNFQIYSIWLNFLSFCAQRHSLYSPPSPNVYLPNCFDKLVFHKNWYMEERVTNSELNNRIRKKILENSKRELSIVNRKKTCLHKIKTAIAM